MFWCRYLERTEGGRRGREGEMAGGREGTSARARARDGLVMDDRSCNRRACGGGIWRVEGGRVWAGSIMMIGDGDCN